MSYERVNWSATTPINTNNLNKMDEGIEQVDNAINDINIIRGILPTDNYSITTTSNYESVDVPIEENLKLGNKLSIENNSIIIGAGVSYVEISGNMVTRTASEVMLIGAAVYKNDERIYTDYNTISSTNFNSFNLPRITIPVEEGDTLKLRIYLDKAGSILLRTYNFATFLEVKVVK